MCTNAPIGRCTVCIKNKQRNERVSYALLGIRGQQPPNALIIKTIKHTWETKLSYSIRWQCLKLLMNLHQSIMAKFVIWKK